MSYTAGHTQNESVAVWAWPATKGHAVTIAPPPTGVVRGMGRKRQKNLVGWDNGSLTEQQTKRTVTTTVPIRSIYKTNTEMHNGSSHRPMLRMLLS